MEGLFFVSVRLSPIIGDDWWLSYVYGLNRPRMRMDFWEDLGGLFGLCSSNWCLGGDFNVIRFMTEKLNDSRKRGV